MRVFLITTAVAAAFAGSATAQVASPTTPVRKLAEDCLRSQAASAVAASSGAADAAGFLLDYLCAGPVSVAGLYERNMATLERFRGIMEEAGTEAELDGISVDPATGEMMLKFAKNEDEAMGAMLGMELMGGMFSGSGGSDGAPVYLRELAARLIMERRAVVD